MTQSQKGFLSGNKHQPSSKSIGDAAEDEALAYLQARGLRLLARNYRTPGRGGGEIDLVMRAPDGTLVFVEVRSRASGRIIRAAQHYLLRWRSLPPCRFDVVERSAQGLVWLPAAFDAA